MAHVAPTQEPPSSASTTTTTTTTTISAASPRTDHAPPTSTADTITVTFAPKDPRDPRNFSIWRKWTIVVSIALIDLTVSWGASGYSPATTNFTKDFDVSAEVGTLGLSLYVLGLALGPLPLAPLSEYYGRTPLYLVPYAIYLFMLLGTALVQNLGGFLVLRFLSGLFSSVTIANFGGTIADLWPRHQVGPAMSIFQWAGVCGSPMGYFLFSFVAGTRPWRDVFWALLGSCGGLWIILVIVLIGGQNETRHSVLLRRRAAKLAAKRDNDDPTVIDVPAEMRRKTLTQLLRVTLSRPFRFLTTEIIVLLAALYNGYLYGLSYLFNGAFSLVFGPKGYGFDTIGVGLSFLGFAIGVSLGPVVNIWQERYYQSRIRHDSSSGGGGSSSSNINPQSDEPDPPFANIPEARVQLAQIAGLTFPISLFWFAWTSAPVYHIHWIVPILATALFGWSFFTLVLMTYVYVEDAYMVYSASALAGVALIRNTAGAGFPLFGTQMFETLGVQWAGSLLAFLALLLAPIPFVLQRYGPRLRARSPYARQHLDGGED